MRPLAILFALALAACSAPTPTPRTAPVPASIAPEASNAASSAPSPTPVGSTIELGPLDDDGVPTTADGEPVLRGSAVETAIGATDDATAMLVGGWFHPPVAIRYCAAFGPDPAVDSCFAFGLYEHRVGGKPIGILPGDVRNAGKIAGAVERPVVLRLHTHDERCGEARGCASMPVADAIVWLGEAPFGSAPPRVIGTAPPGGISQAEAVRRARDESMAHRTPLVLHSAVAGPLWAVLPSEETSQGDIWVWTVVFESDFVSPCGDCQQFTTEEVFLDYRTGAFIMARQ